MNILVTGGAGFIGSHIVDRCLAEGWSVRILDNLHQRVHPLGKPSYLPMAAELLLGDVTVAADWERALDNIDIVCHQAAYQDYFPDYSQFTDVNVTGTALMYEVIARKKLPICRIVVASSQAVYGDGQYRCPEHGMVVSKGRRLVDLERADWEPRCPKCGSVLQYCLLDEGFPCPLSPYGISKYGQELTALGLGKMLGIPSIALRYSITQGARQSLFNQYSGIARIFTLALLNGKAPLAYEDGQLRRDYVHVKDVVEANWLVMKDDRAVGRAFNVGSGVPVTVVEYAQQLAEQIGTNIAPTIPGIYRLGDARHSVSSIESLKSLGWKPQRQFHEIVTDFLAWVNSLGDINRFGSCAHNELRAMDVLRQANV